MKSFKHILVASALLGSLLYTGQAFAISSFGTSLTAAYPGKSLYTGCTVCHDSNVSWFSQYGRILLSQGANYGNPAGFPSVISRAGTLDFDNDGFTVNQEANGGSFAGGSLVGTPQLTGIVINDGVVSAVAGGLTSLDVLTSSASSSPYVTVPAGHKNIGNTVEYTLSNVNAEAGVTLIFSTGGIQTGATVQFIDTYSAINIPATGDTNGRWSIGQDGSISITILDGGSYDLYAAAGIVQSSLAITTTNPPVGNVAGGGDGGDSEGSLHCMTTNVGTQAAMFFVLFMVTLLIRRRTVSSLTIPKQ